MKTSVLALSVAAITVILLAAAPARAQDYAWCAVSSTNGLGQPLCHFATLDQCTAFLNGLTGSCRPNVRAPSTAQSPKRTAR